MAERARRDVIAQWAFDTRPILLRFHLWLEDVEVERSQALAVSDHAFAPRGIARCLAMGKEPPGPQWDGVYEMHTK